MILTRLAGSLPVGETISGCRCFLSTTASASCEVHSTFFAVKSRSGCSSAEGLYGGELLFLAACGDTGCIGREVTSFTETAGFPGRDGSVEDCFVGSTGSDVPSALPLAPTSPACGRPAFETLNALLICCVFLASAGFFFAAGFFFGGFDAAALPKILAIGCPLLAGFLVQALSGIAAARDGLPGRAVSASGVCDDGLAVGVKTPWICLKLVFL